MGSGNRIRLGIDLLFALAGWVIGSFGFTALLKYALRSLTAGFLFPLTIEQILWIVIPIFLCFACGHFIQNKVIKVLLVILICVPLILLLLSYFVVKTPIIPFLN